MRGQGGSCPLDLLSRAHQKSVDGVVFCRLSYFDYSDLTWLAIVCHFHIRGRFFGDISHEKCWKWRFVASKLDNFLGEDTLRPPTRLLPLALTILPPPPPPPPPVTKNLATALHCIPFKSWYEKITNVITCHSFIPWDNLQLSNTASILQKKTVVC